jgi:hypothetical protein
MAWTWMRIVIPSRLRTFMVVNCVVAILMSTLVLMRGSISPQMMWVIQSLVAIALSLFLIGIGPVIMVQAYLYPKQCGVWYAWRHRKDRPRRDSDPTPAHLRHPPTLEALSLRSRFQRVLATKRARTRLFEEAAPTYAPTRAALMLNVADELELAGKKDSARTCYRQIVERFAGSPAAIEAAARLREPAERP